jgi:hypothetical protein
MAGVSATDLEEPGARAAFQTTFTDTVPAAAGASADNVTINNITAATSATRGRSVLRTTVLLTTRAAVAPHTHGTGGGGSSGLGGACAAVPPPGGCETSIRSCGSKVFRSPRERSRENSPPIVINVARCPHAIADVVRHHLLQGSCAYLPSTRLHFHEHFTHHAARCLIPLVQLAREFTGLK